MEQRALTARHVLAAVIAIILLGSIVGAALVAVHRRTPSGPTVTRVIEAPANARAPDGTRIKVEVLNASRVSGLARRATFQLRDHGFDVVESGNAREKHDSTLVLSRSGHDAWAKLVARAMGGDVTVESRPDSSHYVDVTVLIGGAWRPATEPFYP